jgi:hypothetical protein
MDNVKISSLELENIKRVRAVSLEPTADGLTVIGGRNAQGKTSVLDGIAWALGGDKLKPASPNRDGALEPAHLHVELSNGIVVERSGKNGALKVTDSRGMKGGQQLLNSFVSQLALDLPKFLAGTDKQRTEFLLDILGISDELVSIDREYASVYDERRFVGRDADAKAKAAEAMPYFVDAPDAPVSMMELTIKLQEAHATNARNSRERDNIANMVAELARRHNEVGELERRIAEMQQRLDMAKADLEAYEAEVGAKKVNLAQLVDIDVAPIEAAITDAERINAKVRTNADKAAMQAEAADLRSRYDGLSNVLASLNAKRMKLLEDAGMPLQGLSVEDGMLTYNGHVWGDMSGAEQLRVATAITRATKPECGFVLVDKLEQFDTQQLAEFSKWCESEGLQVIGTRVATDDSCTVIIEDGLVVE